MGARPAVIVPIRGSIEFQSTRPAWGRNLFHRRFPLSLPYFNPRAPHGGATNRISLRARRHRISIHAPAWGATNAESGVIACGGISIHAPAWGATTRYENPRIIRVGFQSTRPRGARLIRKRSGVATDKFQSTRPRGARRGTRFRRRSMPYFNPRARVGRDGLPRA